MNTNNNDESWRSRKKKSDTDFDSPYSTSSMRPVSGSGPVQNSVPQENLNPAVATPPVQPPPGYNPQGAPPVGGRPIQGEVRQQQQPPVQANPAAAPAQMSQPTQAHQTIPTQQPTQAQPRTQSQAPQNIDQTMHLQRSQFQQEQMQAHSRQQQVPPAGQPAAGNALDNSNWNGSTHSLNAGQVPAGSANDLSDTGIYPNQFRHDPYGLDKAPVDQKTTNLKGFQPSQGGGFPSGPQDYVDPNATQALNYAAPPQQGVDDFGLDGPPPTGFQEQVPLHLRQPRNPKPKSLPIPVLIGAAVIVVLVGAFVAWQFLSGDDEQASEQNSSTEPTTGLTSIVPGLDPTVPPAAETGEVEISLVRANSLAVPGPVQAGAPGAYTIQILNKPEDALVEVVLNGNSLGEPSADVTPFGFTTAGRQKIEVRVTGSEESSVVIEQYAFDSIVANEWVVLLEQIDRVDPGFVSAVSQYDQLIATHGEARLSEGDFYEGTEPGKFVIFVGGFQDEAAAQEYCTTTGLAGDQCNVQNFISKP